MVTCPPTKWQSWGLNLNQGERAIRGPGPTSEPYFSWPGHSVLGPGSACGAGLCPRPLEPTLSRGVTRLQAPVLWAGAPTSCGRPSGSLPRLPGGDGGHLSPHSRHPPSLGSIRSTETMAVAIPELPEGAHLPRSALRRVPHSHFTWEETGSAMSHARSLGLKPAPLLGGPSAPPGVHAPTPMSLSAEDPSGLPH